MINQSHKSRQPPIVSLRLHSNTLTSSFTRARTFLTSFESRIINANKKMKNLHEQNNEFYQSYSLSKSHLKYVDPFSDIKSVYAKTGYKIPNLSESHNLFKQTPLLIEQKDIDTYYRNNALLRLKNSIGIEKNIFRAGKSQ